MGIKGRLLFLVSIAALPVFLLYVGSELDHRRHQGEQVAHEVIRLAELTAAEQDRFIDVARTLLKALAETAPVREQRADACSAQMIRTLAQLPAYTGLAVAHPEGDVFCSNNPGSIGAKLADRDYFRKAVEHRGFAVGAYRVGVVTGSQIVPMAYYADTPGGPVILVLTLNLERFSDALTLPPLPEGTVVLVLDRKGTVLAFRPDPGTWLGRTAPPESVLSKGVVLGKGVLEGPSLDERPRLFGFAPLGSLDDLVVAVGIPRSLVYADVNRLLFFRMGLLAIVLATAGVAASVFGDRFIVRPLQALNWTVGRLTKGDLRARTSLSSTVPEFAELERRFNAMADSLQRHEDELNQALAAREMLIREISHRIKNSLQMIVGLLQLQARITDSQETTVCLEEAAGRIMAVAKAHERLYRSERIGVVELGPYLRALCDELRQALDAQSDRPRLVDRISEADMAADRAIPLAIIVNELVTNAFKYAYPEGSPGTVEVTFEPDAKGRYRLDVTDGGVGLPPDFDIAKARSLGMRIVSALVSGMGAELDIREERPGTRFTIRGIA